MKSVPASNNASFNQILSYREGNPKFIQDGGCKKNVFDSNIWWNTKTYR